MFSQEERETLRVLLEALEKPLFYPGAGAHYGLNWRRGFCAGLDAVRELVGLPTPQRTAAGYPRAVPDEQGTDAPAAR